MDIYNISGTFKLDDSDALIKIEAVLPIIITVILGIFKPEIWNIIARYNVFINRRYMIGNKLQIMERNRWKCVEIVNYRLYCPWNRKNCGTHLDYLKKGDRRTRRIIDWLTWAQIPKRDYIEKQTEMTPVDYYPRPSVSTSS